MNNIIDEIEKYYKKQNCHLIERTFIKNKDVIIVVKLEEKIRRDELEIYLYDETAIKNCYKGETEFRRHDNFIYATIYHKENKIHISDFYVLTKNQGYGTLLMNYLLKVVEQQQLNNKIKLNEISGNLSIVDRNNGNWKYSIPFYSSFINKIYTESIYYNKIDFILKGANGNIYDKNEISINLFIEKESSGKFLYTIKEH